MRLYLLLHEGLGRPLPEPSYEWVMSRICEEFSCLPMAAEAAWDEDPVLISRILTLRAFTRADAYRTQMEASKDPSAMKFTPMVKRVMEIEAEAIAGVWSHGR